MPNMARSNFQSQTLIFDQILTLTRNSNPQLNPNPQSNSNSHSNPNPQPQTLTFNQNPIHLMTQINPALTLNPRQPQQHNYLPTHLQVGTRF